MTEDRWLCGWRVRSEIPLPELLPWQDGEREPDITFSLGPPPHRLVDPVHEGAALQVSADGTCRLEIRSVATYRVGGGHDVVIAPAPGADASAVRLFTLGTVFGILCHQRGLVPLHASCVRIGDGAVAFTGRSGMGKSSIAAALWRLGYPIISDDVCVIRLGDDGPTSLSAFPRLRLWRDGVERLGLDVDLLPSIHGRAGTKKYSVPIVERFDVRPAPIVAVYHLTDDSSSTLARRRPLAGVDAFERLCRMVYRQRAAENRRSKLFADLSRIAGDVPNWVLPHSRGLPNVARLAETAAQWHNAADQ